MEDEKQLKKQETYLTNLKQIQQVLFLLKNC